MCCSTSGSLFKLNSRHSAWIPPQSRISSLYLKINAYGLDTRINLLAIQQLQTDLTSWVYSLMLGGIVRNSLDLGGHHTGFPSKLLKANFSTAYFCSYSGGRRSRKCNTHYITLVFGKLWIWLLTVLWVNENQDWAVEMPLSTSKVISYQEELDLSTQ